MKKKEKKSRKKTKELKYRKNIVNRNLKKDLKTMNGIQMKGWNGRKKKLEESAYLKKKRGGVETKDINK
jgi:hypothetical protein